jgi:hypothetical protein
MLMVAQEELALLQVYLVAVVVAVGNYRRVL